MEQKLIDLVTKYWHSKISKETFAREFTNSTIENSTEALENIFENIINNHDSAGVEYGLTIINALEKESEVIHILHKLLLEPWHTKYEDIIHGLQRLKSPVSLPVIKEAMQIKYKYLESYRTGTRQFINQCGHALQSIGTSEAIKIIQEFSTSNDRIVKDEMLYRLSRIEGRDDYQRNYDLD